MEFLRFNGLELWACNFKLSKTATLLIKSIYAVNKASHNYLYVSLLKIMIINIKSLMTEHQ